MIECVQYELLFQIFNDNVSGVNMDEILQKISEQLATAIGVSSATALLMLIALVWQIKVLYFSFKQQIKSKDATIELLREKNSGLESSSPDVLVDKLGKRVDRYEAELERLDNENEKNELEAKSREADLHKAHGADKEKFVTEINRLMQESERYIRDRDLLTRNFELEISRLAKKLKGMEQSIIAFRDLEIGLMPETNPLKFTQEILEVIKPRLFEDFELLDFEQVAAILETSTQTLRRKLASEGTSYQALKDVIREEMAVTLLGAGKDIKVVSESVGFTDTSTFHRAFKKWTGNTPAEHQKKQALLEHATADAD